LLLAALGHLPRAGVGGEQAGAGPLSEQRHARRVGDGAAQGFQDELRGFVRQGTLRGRREWDSDPGANCPPYYPQSPRACKARRSCFPCPPNRAIMRRGRTGSVRGPGTASVIHGETHMRKGTHLRWLALLLASATTA